MLYTEDFSMRHYVRFSQIGSQFYNQIQLQFYGLDVDEKFHVSMYQGGATEVLSSYEKEG